ncbi:hypothetical protein ACHAWF_006259 [Thalassiosira exigua]
MPGEKESGVKDVDVDVDGGCRSSGDVEEEEEEEEGEEGGRRDARSLDGNEDESRPDPFAFRLRWYHAVELSGILALMAAALAVEYASTPLNVRPIPVQVLQAGDQQLFVRDLDLDHEFREDETVGTAGLVLIGVVAPLLLQLVLVVASRAARDEKKWGCYRTFCSYLLSFALILLTIDLIKLYAGVLRPHFYDSCEPDDSYRECTAGDAKEERSRRESFPSGHAGIAFAGLGNLARYVHRRFGAGGRPRSSERGTADTRGQFAARLWSLVSLLPVFLAMFIGTSRIYDDYHHPADVVGGSLIGAGLSYFSHGIYFVEM